MLPLWHIHQTRATLPNAIPARKPNRLPGAIQGWSITPLTAGVGYGYTCPNEFHSQMNERKR